MYKHIIRPIFFLFNPEKIHGFTMGVLSVLQKVRIFNPLVRALYQCKDPKWERTVFGIKFPNPIGLAAGLDKDGEAIDMLGFLGFGFVEVGTVTPVAQPGNPKPRLFRLKRNKGLINRMGFNNNGVEALVKRLKQKYSKVVVGGNIGKNKITPNDQAVSDYIKDLQALHDYVDYIAVNISSPNTPNLRELQNKEPLKQLLSALKEEDKKFAKSKPILLKIAPDLTEGQLDDIVAIVREVGIDGIIATNTTIARDGIDYTKEEIEAFGAGGMSGQPVKKRSTEVIRYLHQKTNGEIPIIGVGGISDADDVREKLEAGATLVELFTSFIYNGPACVKKILKKL
ncbi:MAG: quinone-dependent dihydroorotate dehydrogenase [Bacteroidales bacterium]|nr:quinone-dependent dihydroorotate dehydrogenase [Bacteroidales bacterium]